MRGDDQHTMTIEELAAASGMTVRNIRSHRARGLLQPPVVRDRVGYYGPEHADRLRLIQDLQAEGFNLNGIKKLIERTGADAERLLAVKHAATLPFEDEPPQVVTIEELRERFGPQADARALEKAVDVGGLVDLGDGRYEAPAPALLDVAAEVVAHGVPLHHALVVMGKVRERCQAIGREFVRLFLDDVWTPFVEDDHPDERWDDVVRAIEHLRPLSSRAVLAIYQTTMTREVEVAFGKELERMARSRRG